MNLCDDLLGALRRAEEWRCVPIPGQDTILVTTDRHYADGDTVELLVRRGDDELTASDGGATAARLDLAGINWLEGQARSAWEDILADFHLHQRASRVFARGSLSDAPDLLTRLTEGVISLDALRHFVSSTQSERFESQVVSWLRNLGDVEARARVRTRGGGKRSVTARFTTGRREVLVQAAGRQPESAEHAYFVFSNLVDDYVIQQRVTVLGDQPSKWRPDVVEPLLRACYVASWQRTDRLSAFLRGEYLPKHHNLMANGYQPSL